jgi:hypothetical protein
MFADLGVVAVGAPSLGDGLNQLRATPVGLIATARSDGRATWVAVGRDQA